MLVYQRRAMVSNNDEENTPHSKLLKNSGTDRWSWMGKNSGDPLKTSIKFMFLDDVGPSFSFSMATTGVKSPILNDSVSVLKPNPSSLLFLTL